jgi:uncharacterized protein Yka (UPF0111/DUF47 family)
VEIDAAAIATALKAAEESAAMTKGLADKSTVVEERIAGYETRIAKLESQCDSINWTKVRHKDEIFRLVLAARTYLL